MKLPFLNRLEERQRLAALLAQSQGSLGVVYGRRRAGKSRLIQHCLSKTPSVLYVGDDREPALQRASLAREIALHIPGFDQVAYPEWEAIFARWWGEAKAGSVLALDEFPSLVSGSREIPSIIQKYVDRHSDKAVHLLLAGSSQRMMQGLVLDHNAPLYGRAGEIFKISPLSVHWLAKALKLEPVSAIESYAVWGGIPRYWELAADCADRNEALRTHVLSPMGVLHDEPVRLLLDDMRETVQASSILSLVGQGCHRMSEIAGRLGKPATSLSRPVQRLTQLDLIRRETPFGASARTAKRSVYRIDDPFLRYWFRFVEPNRSRLHVQKSDTVLKDIETRFPSHVGEAWEDLARISVSRLRLHGESWGPAQRWWGTGIDRSPMEIDLVCESTSTDALLIGEVKWERSTDIARSLAELKRKADNLPLAKGRVTKFALWVKSPGKTRRRDVVTPAQVVRVMR